jgi:hypothetical protein
MIGCQQYSLNDDQPRWLAVTLTLSAYLTVVFAAEIVNPPPPRNEATDRPARRIWLFCPNRREFQPHLAGFLVVADRSKPKLGEFCGRTRENYAY